MPVFKQIACISMAIAAMGLAFPAIAQEQAVAAATAEAVPEPVGPALWKVADDDTTIYLFGTVHALPTGLSWYKGPIAAALASSDQLVTEIITDDQTALKMQQLVLDKGMLPADQSLRGLLNVEQRKTFDEAMTKLGLPPTAFDRFEPWYASMMMSMLPLMKEGYSAESGVEYTLSAAAGAGKPRGELETVEWQIDLFDTLPQDMQIKYLMETAAAVDEIKPMLDAMVAEWIAGDADDLAKLMNESMEDPRLADTLLYSRNRTWAQWIGQRLAQPGTIFIAVGAGHLAGDQSVQAALEKLGVATTRIQ